MVAIGRLRWIASRSPIALMKPASAVVPPPPSWVLKAHIGGAIGSAGGTIGPINTTGADLLIASVSYYNGFTTANFSDSNANAWTLIKRQISGIVNVDLYYVNGAPIVGPGHTFTSNVGGTYPAICVSAWQGSAVSPLDQINGSATASPGSVTPSQNNELVVAVLASENGGTPPYTIDTGFTVSDSVSYAGGNNEGGAMAYLVQTSALAVSPTWGLVGTPVGSAIATFK